MLVVSMFSLDSGDKIGSIVGGVIAALGLGWVIYRALHQWLIWRNPLDITYLIPQAQYKCAQFPGNPEKEQYPKSLVINTGEQIIMFRVKPKIDAPIDGITLEFPNENGPDISGSDSNPFIAGHHLLSGKVQDWHGIWHNPGSGSMLRKNEYNVQGYKINATHEYDGMARIRFRIQGRRNVLVYDLPLRIVKFANLSTPHREGSQT